MKKIFALIAVAALVAFAAPAFAANPFADVPMNHWAYDAVAQLAASGIVVGYPDGAYKGGQPATRYELAAVVARALAKVDMEKASKQDLEMLKKLVVEFKSELDALGVKVDKLDARVAVLEEGVGGWKLSGNFRMDWKWADEEDGQYTEYTDHDAVLRTPSNYLQFVKKIDDNVSYRARLRFNDDEWGVQWKENFITVKLPYEITGKFGMMNLLDWEGESGLYQADFGDDAWFLDGRYEGMWFKKDFSMGDFQVFFAEAGTGDAGFSGSWAGGYDFTGYLYGARVNFNVNEQFRFALNGFKYDLDYDDGMTVYWADFGFNFTPDVAFKGAYYFEDMPWDDGINGWKAILDMNENVLKFTTLWVEYGQMDAGFVTDKQFLAYAEGPSGAGWFFDERYGGDKDYLLVIAKQPWTEKFSTWVRYLQANADYLPDHTNYGVFLRYQYTPALMFELGYDKFDSDADSYDDSMVRFRTEVSF